jgi:hypothetical protein
MELKVSAALPVLVTVITCGALVTPNAWFPKLRLVVESDAVCPFAKQVSDSGKHTSNATREGLSVPNMSNTPES